MISRILKSTAGKPCSCPEGKICKGCTKKKTVKPQVYIEEPRRLPVPIVISRPTRSPAITTVQTLKPRRWSHKKPKERESKKCVLKTTLCQWYKKRKAFNELKNDYQKQKKREKQERIEKAAREREIEVLEQMILQSQAEPPVTPKKEKPVVVKKQKPKPIPKPTPTPKPKRVKARTATAKPRADTKYVTAKRYNRYDSLSNRFVNCCYRVCCQFYCYVTCIFIIGFVIIYFL